MSDPDLRRGSPPGPPDSPIEHLPTHQAAANNDTAELAELIQQGSQTVGTESKETPLHAAAKKGATDTLKWLLENKTASPLERAGNGNSAAHYAAVYGHLKALKLLIEYDMEHSSQVVSQLDESGLSLISLATLQGDEEMAGWLIDNYPEIADIPNANGDLAVHFAAAQGHLGILKLLVRHYGKDIVEKQDKNATKPVYFASQEGRLTVLDYLINELGADPVAREKSGISSVHAAVQAGQYKAVKWLVSKLGPKYLLDKTIDGATPLHMAAAQGHTDILHYLLENLENKGDVNVLDHIHATPAHDAAEFGQMESMLLLLKNGADISIKDTENKTPYELAIEQHHPDVAAMIADLRDNGPTALAKYEKKKRSSSQPASLMRPRTTHMEAEELTAAIRQTSDIQEQRKHKELQRQESLQRMHERGLEEDEKKSDEDEIEHTLGPNGDIYARPKKRKNRHKNGAHRQGSDEDLLDNTSFPHPKQKNSLLDNMLPLDDSNYPSPNQETASNYSRPSRVRRYQDSDSEITSISSQYRGGRHNVPGFYPPYGDSGYFPPLPPPRKGHHSSASSLHSSKTGRSRRRGYPHMMPYVPYGYYPAMPYPYPYQYGPQQQMQGYRPKTTEERMHLAALQQGQSGAGHMIPGQTVYYYQQPMMGRRSKLKKRSRSRQPSRDPSPPGTSRKHTDADMGYGPAVQNRDEGSVVGGAKGRRGGATKNPSGFHPQAPPITGTDGSAQAGDSVVNFDSNFIMMKKTDTVDDIKQLGGTMLNLAKPPKHYDGRWDSYIMTDSESEHEVDESYSVAFAAETAAILAIGCVSGLKGLKKLRRGGPVDTTQPDKAYLSSAWDEPPMPTKGHSRRGSISGLADPSLKDVSPEDFAAREEMGEQAGWSGGEKKSKKKKGKKGDRDELNRSASAEALDKQPQSELLAGELERQSFASVSRNFGQKMLFDALGARESSMLNIASTSRAGSMMSLDHSGDDEQDDFNETIQMVHSLKTEKKKSNKKQNENLTLPDKAVAAGQGAKEGSERPRSARKEKQKAKEEERVRKEREREEKREGKRNTKKEKQKKKDELKKTSKEAKVAKEAGSATSVTSPKRPTSPKKKSSPPVPARSAPPPPPKQPTSSSSSAPAYEPQVPNKSSPPVQPKRQQPTTTALQQKHKEQQRPTATSTPVASKNGVTPKKNRMEKAQLKSSPQQHTRSTAPSKQTSRVLQSEARQKSTPRLDTKPPTSDFKPPTEKKNRYFEDELDDDEGMGTLTATSGGSKSKSKPQDAMKNEVDPGMAELDDVLAQLESIQTGGLMSWLDPNTVTKVDSSNESEDSLPLVLPTTPLKKKKTKKKEQPSPPRARAEHTRQERELGDEVNKIGFPGTANSGLGSSPPQPESRGTGTQSSSSQTETETAVVLDVARLERTKHGSPHPRRAAKKAAATSTTAADEQRSRFEQEVMSTLEALKESMNQLKGNPTITQTEITEQQLLQKQLIHNLITYSQHDPQLVNKLLSLLNTDKVQDGLETSSSHQLEELQQRILGAHEKTYQETQEHFRTQEALQRAIQKTLEEQTQQQMKGMQANFEMFSKLMEEQLSEQRKKFEEELKKREKEEEEEEEEVKEKRRKKKKDHSKKKDRKKKRRRYSESESISSGTGEEEGMVVASTEMRMPAVKTMEAKIFTQDLLGDETATKPSKGRIRRPSDVEYFRTMEALSRHLPLEETLDNEEEEEDDDELHFQHARPVTIRRADIKVQSQDDYTPLRPTRTSSDSIDSSRGQLQKAHMQAAPTRPPAADEDHFDDFHMLKQRPPKQLESPEKKPDFDEKNLRFGKQHVEVDERPKSARVWDPLAGAGGELGAALHLRQKQMKRERK